MNYISWIQNNWTEVVAAIGGVVILARVIVKVTPSPADDSALERVISFLKSVGLHIK